MKKISKIKIFFFFFWDFELFGTFRLIFLRQIALGEKVTFRVSVNKS